MFARGHFLPPRHHCSGIYILYPLLLPIKFSLANLHLGNTAQLTHNQFPFPLDSSFFLGPKNTHSPYQLSLEHCTLIFYHLCQAENTQPIHNSLLLNLFLSSFSPTSSRILYLLSSPDKINAPFLRYFNSR